MPAARKQKAGPATVVVLRFAEGIKIEIVTGMSAKAAIADVAGRALANGASLPLIEAVTSEIPATRLIELVDGRREPPPSPDQRPPLPIQGAIHAVGAYVRATSAKEPQIPQILNARDALRDFFARYGCPIDFAGEPEPGENI